MRRVWLVIAVGLVGCTTGPKREMRPPTQEELVSPTTGYDIPPDYTRDQPLLQPKKSSPGLNTPAMPGVGSPGGMGTGPGMAPGGMRR